MLPQEYGEPSPPVCPSPPLSHASSKEGLVEGGAVGEAVGGEKVSEKSILKQNGYSLDRCIGQGSYATVR